MKLSVLLLIAVSLLLPKLAAAETYDITAELDKKRGLVFAFKTKVRQKKICVLRVVKLRLEHPWSVGDKGNPEGRLDLVTKNSGQCLETPGPHGGKLDLPISEDAQAPTLLVGKYRLVIDGEEHGYLLLKKDGVSVQP